MNPGFGYTRPAIALHWLVALLVFAGWSLGVYMHELPSSPDKLRFYTWHKWIGVTVFLLTVLRVGWLATHRPPALPPGMPGWQVHAARVSHALLYVLTLALPLSGWLMSSAKGVQTVYLGLVPLPDLVGKNPPLGELFEDVHKLLAFTLAGLVVVHLLAALKHHFLDRTEVLARMVPGLRPPGARE